MLVKSQAKYIQSLGQKKYRDEHHVFVAEGPKILAELLRDAKANLQSIYALPNWIEANESLLHDTNTIPISDSELERISQLKTPNQVLALVKQFDEQTITTSNTITLALDTIQDPGNLGTIIRVCDWFAVNQIVCSLDCADRYNPKVV